MNSAIVLDCLGSLARNQEPKPFDERERLLPPAQPLRAAATRAAVKNARATRPSRGRQVRALRFTGIPLPNER